MRIGYETRSQRSARSYVRSGQCSGVVSTHRPATNNTSQDVGRSREDRVVPICSVETFRRRKCNVAVLANSFGHSQEFRRRNSISESSSSSACGLLRTSGRKSAESVQPPNLQRPPELDTLPRLRPAGYARRLPRARCRVTAATPESARNRKASPHGDIAGALAVSVTTVVVQARPGRT